MSPLLKIAKRVKKMIEKYQARAQQEGTDPLGYYVAPMAYVQLQIVEQAITATQSLDDMC
jgi:branched-chain amino acid transport system substrate-binding protein